MSSHSVAPGDRSVPWRDVFPKACRLKPVKYVCSINARSLPETTEPESEFRYVDISNVDSDGNWVSSDPMRFGDAPSRARRVVADGDVLVSTVRTYLRAIAHIDRVDEPLICSTGFAVLSANGAVASRFLAYWARSVHFVDEVVARSVGVSYPAVNAPDIGNIPCPVLPLDEQRAIAAFLDRETARIDALIGKKRRQIKLLHEKRAALISHAVTKGLDPNAPMRDSGIDWLGQIPKHWKVLAVKFALATPITDGPHETPEFLPDGIPFLSAESVKDDRLDFNRKRGFISPAEHARFSRKYAPMRGDVYMVKSGATTGNVARVETDDVFNIWSPLAVLRPHPTHSTTDFIFYFMKSRAFLASVELAWSYGTQQNIGMGVVSNLRIALPPLEEQRAIAAILNTETDCIDALVRKVHVSIEMLREYRTALISAAVTGKIDVRQEVA